MNWANEVSRSHLLARDVVRRISASSSFGDQTRAVSAAILNRQLANQQEPPGAALAKGLPAPPPQSCGWQWSPARPATFRLNAVVRQAAYLIASIGMYLTAKTVSGSTWTHP
jgi:hypothetical protein